MKLILFSFHFFFISSLKLVQTSGFENSVNTKGTYYLYYHYIFRLLLLLLLLLLGRSIIISM